MHSGNASGGKGQVNLAIHIMESDQSTDIVLTINLTRCICIIYQTRIQAD